jgi:transglutaminase-like putative cysteine protease
LIAVCLCLVGLALAAPQLGTTGSPVSTLLADDEPATAYGPVQGSYFRAMSYDRYTGSGWERTADAAALSNLGPPPGGGDRLRVSYEVQAPVRTTPAPWRPTAYDGPEAVAVEGSIEPVAAYSPGEEFTVTSRRRATAPASLARAGADYPDGLDRYRRLPDDTPSALGEVTNDVTADARTPYGKAVAINRWLRTEKDYSLSVDRPDGDVATGFLTEMDAGFCQYFATAMVAMLRAEDVPARYVTGYTPYEPVGDGEHVIRGKYAHTWVEVYFPDVGWVAFDPTPPAERRDRRGVGTTDGASNGSSAFRAARATETRRDEEPGGWRQIAADIEIETELTAGTDATVTVRDPEDGTPIEGAQVRFNGRPVGETDADGRVRAEVPYRQELVVSVYVYDGTGEPPPVVEPAPAEEALSERIRDLRYAPKRTEVVGSLTELSDQVLFRATVERGTLGPAAADPSRADGSQAARTWSPRRISRTGQQGPERTFGVNTTLDVTVTPASGGAGAERPGEPLAVRATIRGQPVSNATVTAGERSARTDANGTATVPAPYRRPAVVTVAREEANGTSRIDVGSELSVTAGEAAVAGEFLTVTATLSDGTPVPGATVTNGIETAATDADGTATIPAPYEPQGTITVRRGDFRDSVSAPADTGTGTLELDPAVPGPGRELRATYRDVPVRNANVTDDGDRVARTDGAGRATVTVPYAESITYTVERGGVTARRTFDLPTNATVTTDGPAVPGGRLPLRATVEDEPLPGATVRLDGRPVGKTDANGEATVRVPVTAPVPVLSVERGAVRTDVTLESATVVWAMTLVGLAGVAAVAMRRGLGAATPGDPGALVATLRARNLRTLAGRLRTGDPFAVAAGRLRTGDPFAVAATLEDRLRAVLAGLHARVAALLAERDAGAPEPDPDTGTPAPTASTSPPDDPASDNDVYRAWATFRSGLDGDSESPATVADRARRAGLPEEAVAELTRTFRTVRYGGADPTPEREQRAREALDRIREATR